MNDSRDLNKPLVSIIVPIYNSMQWLAECIESIRGQTYKEIEIILVDDGSTDFSGVICDAYAEMDSRIVVIHQENKMLSAARNAGMKIAKGKYLMFADSDDYVADNWCECLVELAEMHPDALVCGCKAIVDSTGVTVRLLDKAKATSEFHYGNYLQFCKNDISSSVCNKIFLKQDVEEQKLYFDETVTFGEDKIFALSFLRMKKYVVVRNLSPLYFCRVWHTDSLCYRFLGVEFFSYMKKMTKIIEGLIIQNEKQEFYNWRFNDGIRCLRKVLDLRNTDSIEKQVSDCQKIMESPEFIKWSREAEVKQENNKLYTAIYKGETETVCKLLIEQIKQQGFA